MSSKGDHDGHWSAAILTRAMFQRGEGFGKRVLAR